jgi:branched-chain amino acid transport system ATP-binding protein
MSGVSGTSATAPAVELDGVARHFGSLKAVDGVSLTVEGGSRHAVIGPNGAGKSTLFALIAGTLTPTAGRILLGGEDVTGMPEHRRAMKGLVRTFQHSSLFLRSTALENVILSVQRQQGAQWSMLRPLGRRAALLERAHTLLEGIGLSDRAAALAGSLSHGERRQLEVAVALGADPSVLLLDEPAAGMSAAETAQFKELVLSLPREITVMLVEHDLDLVFGLAERVTVLHLGGHLMTGAPAEVRASDEVQRAYLGAEDTSELFPEEAR